MMATSLGFYLLTLILQFILLLVSCVVGFNGVCDYELLLGEYIGSRLGIMAIYGFLASCWSCDANILTTCFAISIIPLIGLGQILFYWLYTNEKRLLDLFYNLYNKAQIMAILWRIPMTVLLILIAFDDDCRYQIEAFSYLVVFLIIFEIICYGLFIFNIFVVSKNIPYLFDKSNLIRWKFEFFYQLFGQSLCCMEIITILLCIINYFYFNIQHTLFDFIWIIFIIISFPFSTVMIYAYYIDKSIFLNLNKYNNNNYKNDIIKSELLSKFYYNASKSFLFDNIYSMLHVLRYHSSIDILQEKQTKINSESSGYLSLVSRNDYDIQSIKCVSYQQCTRNQLEYIRLDSKEKYNEFIQSQINDLLVFKFNQWWKITIIVLWIMIKFYCMVFPIYWFGRNYYLDFNGKFQRLLLFTTVSLQLILLICLLITGYLLFVRHGYYHLLHKILNLIDDVTSSYNLTIHRNASIMRILCKGSEIDKHLIEEMYTVAKYIRRTRCVLVCLQERGLIISLGFIVVLYM